MENTNYGSPVPPARAGGQPSPSREEAVASPPALLPSVSLPKGGGAIRGIGEKFSTNPATGTGSLSIPIATSPGRAGFELSLQLTYDSGAGNGPFGLGWNLSTPAITRKTDKGLPQYLDAVESDTFILSGAEDLVPVGRAATRGEYSVQQFQPRVEGLFARIGRWTRNSDRDTHWRAVTRDNVTNIYGASPGTRISHPEHPERIFSWLLQETRDDRGNVARYSYKAEDGAGVDSRKVSEMHRFRMSGPGNGAISLFLATTQRYLKRIEYGNRRPHDSSDSLFEVVFDYGEHHDTQPTPLEERPWPVRADPFSTYRPGFEVRTYRRCRRLLMFHHFTELDLGFGPCLVRSTDMHFAASNETENATGAPLSYLVQVEQCGYTRDSKTGLYSRATLPPLELHYSAPKLNDRLRITDTVALEGIPSGVDDALAQWVDLNGEGIPGVLISSRGALYYKANLGDGGLAPPDSLPTLPGSSDLSGRQFLDLGADGALDLVQLAPPTPVFFTRTSEGGWTTGEFQSMPAIDSTDPNVRFLDLDGDGLTDILLTKDEVLVWYRSKGKAGFEFVAAVPKPSDEARGPAVIFADGTQSIQLADMSGDGLVDIVRVTNKETCYWPNLGRAVFGPKVVMHPSPEFCSEHDFDPRRLRFADIDGSGTTDVLYLNNDGIRIWFNASGNGWISAAGPITSLPVPHNLADVSVNDILGQGTPCIVWSSAIGDDAAGPLAYVDLMGGEKPHLLTSIVNNLGAETRIGYTPSTRFYLDDQKAGKPWLTRLAFPVHVIERIERHDCINKSMMVTRFAYHHGFFDGQEREFRGFSCVEQWDAESFGAERGKGLFSEVLYDVDPAGANLNLPPVRTITWFHTGAWLEGRRLEQALAEEYYERDAEAPLLRDTVLPAVLSDREKREAARALRGKILRQEIYAEDETPESAHPYSVSERNYEIRCLEHARGTAHAIFFVHPRETIDLHYERDPDDPRMQQEVVLDVDEFGNITRSASLGYPRRSLQRAAEESSTGRDLSEQSRLWATLTQASFINKAEEPGWYRIGVPVESATWELTGLRAPESPGEATGAKTRWRALTIEDLRTALNAAVPVSYEQRVDGSGYTLRLLDAQRTRYYSDDLQPLPVGDTGSVALQYETYRMALTDGLVENVLNHDIEDQSIRIEEAWLRDECRYIRGAEIPVAAAYRTAGELVPPALTGSSWWAPSGHIVYEDATRARSLFYLPEKAVDPFGGEHTVGYDDHALLIRLARDPVGNSTAAESDYRVLAPWRLTDPNRNRTAVAFNALGMVTRTAVMGKEDPGEGDTLEDPTTTLEYDLHRWKTAGKPAYIKTRLRERHRNPDTPWQESYSYSDGSGREVMRKIQAERGLAPVRNASGELVRDADGRLVQTQTDRRWVGTGRTVFDNKGNPIKKYDPFFSSTAEYEDEKDLVEWGVTPILRYDPLGRLVRTDQPNGSYFRVRFDAWSQESWDENDCVLESAWYRERGSPRPDGPEPLAALGESDPQVLRTVADRRSAWLAAQHAGTPGVAHLDSLGRVFLNVAHNRIVRDTGTVEERYATRIELDIEGNQRSVTDARGLVVLRQDFDVLGRVLHTSSPDAGRHWTLLDVADKPARSWDSRKHAFRRSYDVLQRPTHVFVAANGGEEKLVQCTLYGESLDMGAEDLNLRGQVYQDYDGAGVVTNARFDFRGNLLESTRRLTRRYNMVPDWSALALPTLTVGEIETAAEPLLHDEVFATSTAFDALNRVVSRITSDNSETQPTYNESNLLESVKVRLRGAEEWTTFIEDIDYSARGQRELVKYGNHTRTEYGYDERSFRLTSLRTLRNGNGRLQDLTYAYDPVGNITDIADGAQQTIFFDGDVVRAQGRYRYDAIYQLIEAEGREHPGLGQPSHEDPPIAPLPHPNDGQALRRYTESYFYDAVGNIDHVAHRAGSSGWTRSYAYEQGDGHRPLSNRLLSTSLPGDPEDGPYSATYDYDAHGNTMRMPHLPEMRWDHADRLVGVDLGGGGDAYYLYDSSGQRVRKIVVKNSAVEERIYLGGYETYRKHKNGDIDFERQTLHVMDDRRRVALVETKARQDGVDLNDPSRQRYQLDNHLGSSLLEVDSDSVVLTYEEYFPYGGTAYRSTRSQGRYQYVEESPKRYRYNGKERDEETGLYYHGARHYAAWLGRWVSSDPDSRSSLRNPYWAMECNPMSHVDPSGRWPKLSELIDTVQQHIGQLWNADRPDLPEDTNGIEIELSALDSAEFDTEVPLGEAMIQELETLGDLGLTYPLVGEQGTGPADKDDRVLVGGGSLPASEHLSCSPTTFRALKAAAGGRINGKDIATDPSFQRAYNLWNANNENIFQKKGARDAVYGSPEETPLTTRRAAIDAITEQGIGHEITDKSDIQRGDILQTWRGSEGHSSMVYDVKRDDTGKIIDLIVISATTPRGSKAIKIQSMVSIIGKARFERRMGRAASVNETMYVGRFDISVQRRFH